MPALSEPIPAAPIPERPPWLRARPGNGASSVRVEVPCPDELRPGIPAQPAPSLPHAQRAEGGRLKPGAGTTELARRASEARWAKHRESLRALERLGLRGVAPEAIRPYLDDAQQFAKHEVERLAREVGGGECGAGAASMVQHAALATAASRYLYDAGFAAADAKLLGMASRLADSARQNLLAAHAAVVEAARARGKTDPHSDLDRRLGLGGPTP